MSWNGSSASGWFGPAWGGWSLSELQWLEPTGHDGDSTALILDIPEMSGWETALPDLPPTRTRPRAAHVQIVGDLVPPASTPTPFVATMATAGILRRSPSRTMGATLFEDLNWDLIAMASARYPLTTWRRTLPVSAMPTGARSEALEQLGVTPIPDHERPERPLRRAAAGQPPPSAFVPTVAAATVAMDWWLPSTRGGDRPRRAPIGTAAAETPMAAGAAEQPWTPLTPARPPQRLGAGGLTIGLPVEPVAVVPPMAWLPQMPQRTITAARVLGPPTLFEDLNWDLIAMASARYPLTTWRRTLPVGLMPASSAWTHAPGAATVPDWIAIVGQEILRVRARVRGIPEWFDPLDWSMGGAAGVRLPTGPLVRPVRPQPVGGAFTERTLVTATVTGWDPVVPAAVRARGRAVIVGELRADTTVVTAPHPWPAYPDRTWRPVGRRWEPGPYTERDLVVAFTPLPDMQGLEVPLVRRLLPTATLEVRAETLAVRPPEVLLASMGPVAPRRANPAALAAETRADTTVVTAPHPWPSYPHRTWRAVSRETAGLTLTEVALGAASVIYVPEGPAILPPRRVRGPVIITPDVERDLPFPLVPFAIASGPLRRAGGPAWLPTPTVVAHEAVVVPPVLSWANVYPPTLRRARPNNLGAALAFVAYVPYSTQVDRRRAIRVSLRGTPATVSRRASGIIVPIRKPTPDDLP